MIRKILVLILISQEVLMIRKKEFKIDDFFCTFFENRRPAIRPDLKNCTQFEAACCQQVMMSFYWFIFLNLIYS